MSFESLFDAVGADKRLRNQDNKTPLDLTHDPNVRSLLEDKGNCPWGSTMDVHRLSDASSNFLDLQTTKERTEWRWERRRRLWLMPQTKHDGRRLLLSSVFSPTHFDMQYIPCSLFFLYFITNIMKRNTCIAIENNKDNRRRLEHVNTVRHDIRRLIEEAETSHVCRICFSDQSWNECE